MEPASATDLRPPWPDELWRVRHYLPAGFLYDDAPRLYVAVRGPAERLVAAAALSFRPLRRQRAGSLCVRLDADAGGRTRLLDLVRPALDDAWAAGARRVVLAQSVRVDSPQADTFRAMGFVAEEAAYELHEAVWKKTTWPRLDRIYQRMRAGGLIPADAALTAMRPETMPAVRRFLAAHLESGAASVALPSAGFRPEHSLVLWVDGGVKGVHLCRHEGVVAHTGLRLVAPELRGGLGWANLLLLHASAEAMVQSGIKLGRFEFEPRQHEDTRQLAATLEARRVATLARLSIDRPSPASPGLATQPPHCD